MWRRPAAVRGPDPAAWIEDGAIVAITVGCMPAGVDGGGGRLSVPARPPPVVGGRVVSRRVVVGKQFPVETARVGHITLPCRAGTPPLRFEFWLSAGWPEWIRSKP
jgi:hypothetical protein